MADKRGAGGALGGVPTWAVALVALLMAGGLMAWLAATAEPSNSGMVVVEETDTLAAAADQVPPVSLASFADDDDPYIGRDVRFTSAPVDSRMGTQGFWLKLPNQGLYLVRAPQGMEVRGGQEVEVVGPVREMSDSVVSAWLEDGTITANQEMEARYATSFIDAWYVRPAVDEGNGAGAAQ